MFFPHLWREHEFVLFALGLKKFYLSLHDIVVCRVSNATVSVANVEDAHSSTRLLAQTTLRNILGTKDLYEILSNRESISGSMQANKKIST